MMTYQEITPEQAQELLNQAQIGLAETYEAFAQTITDAAVQESKVLLEADEKKQTEDALNQITQE